MPCFPVSAPVCKQVFFLQSVYWLIFHIFVGFVGEFPFQMVPKSSSAVLSHVSKYKKAVMCLIQKIHMSGKLLSGVNDSAVSPEFTVNESTTYVK